MNFPSAREAAYFAMTQHTVVNFPPDFRNPVASIVADDGACCDATIDVTLAGPQERWTRGAGAACDLATSLAYVQAITIAGALARSGRRSWGQSGRVVTITHTVDGWEVRTLSRGHYDAHKTGRVIAIVGWV